MIARSRSQAEIGLRLLDSARWIAFGKMIPMVLFSLLAWRQLQALQAALGAAAVARGSGLFLAYLAVWNSAVYLLFCAIPVGLYLTRQRPLARDGRLVARLVAFIATVMLLVVGAKDGTPRIFDFGIAGEVFAAVLEGAALALAVWGLLHLRRNLSIIPEARAVVSTGPYRFIRHPLYTAEIAVALGMTATRPSMLLLPAVALFATFQIMRASWEERLLSSALPGYGQYRRTTRRLVPLLW